MKYTLSILLMSLSLMPQSHGAIFGKDSRHNVAAGSKWDFLARSTAISVIKSNFTDNGDGTRAIGVGEFSDLCSYEKFKKEPLIPMSCTGFLVGPDLLATAGHCLYAINTAGYEIKNETEFTCPIFDWVFDFQKDENGKVNTSRVKNENIYHCKKIIYATQRPVAPFTDYALIQLDRVVSDRTPLKMNLSTPAAPETLHMIGHPFGQPTKRAYGAKVLLDNPLRTSFITNLDAFEGNSGSPVFNSANEVVGILVSGTPSWNTFKDTRNSCERLNRCNDRAQNCLVPDKDTSVFPEFQTVGSEVQRIKPIFDLIQNP